MPVRDELTPTYYRLLTRIPERELDVIGADLEAQCVNPMVVKKRLAREIVAFEGALELSPKERGGMRHKRQPPAQGGHRHGATKAAEIAGREHRARSFCRGLTPQRYCRRTARRFPGCSSSGACCVVTSCSWATFWPLSRTPPWSMSLRAALLVGARPVSTRLSTIRMLAWPFSSFERLMLGTPVSEKSCVARRFRNVARLAPLPRGPAQRSCGGNGCHTLVSPGGEHEH